MACPRIRVNQSPVSKKSGPFICTPHERNGWTSHHFFAAALCLHAALPRLDFFDRRLHSDWVTYRSARTGWWRPVAEPRGRYETQLAEKPITDWSGVLPFSEEFHRELENRGALLVLTLVPYVDAQVGHLEFLSDELGVPAIVPSFDGVTVADGSHLNRESAGTVSLSFWEAFLALPEVRDAVGIDRAH